ncbi:MAG TPA: ankyrin repeat domain-containing protein [Bryobacteraceae bacterium]|jgi:ankyrin repeat protein|nr:ankyrin repeat domain-containing protein [Bryobacteraceae bacterium]
MRKPHYFSTGLFAICQVTRLFAADADPGLALTEAAEQGNLNNVKSLVQKSDVNSAQGDGMTALHWAAYREDVEMARVLIQAGANVNAANRLKAVTPLLIASNAGNAAVIDLLLKNGADANLANTLGTTPLMLAAASGKVDAVKTLLDHGANVNARESSRRQTALMFAAALDRDAVVRLLASRGADLNATSKIVPINADIVDEDGNSIPAPSRTGATKKRGEGEGKVAGMGGMTALHYAAREGLMATVQGLVEAGVDVNKTSPVDKSTSLVIAISNGHYDVAKYLVDHGADSNIETIDGLAPLYATIESRWAPVAWTPTAFTSAAGITQQQTNYLDLMKLLLEHGANPNAKINKTLWFDPPHHNDSWAKAAGTTAFWRAAQATDLDAMKLLVSHGADPKIASAERDTPLAVAAGVGWNGNFSTNAPNSFMAAAKYLVEDIQIDVNAADASGYTAAMGAAYRGDNEIIQYLIAKGARLDVKTKRGWSVTDMANGPYLRSSFPLAHPDTVALLQKLGAPAPIKVQDEEILGVIGKKGEKGEKAAGERSDDSSR